MGAGLPVVSFSCPCGPKDMIDDGQNGLLVENDNVQQLADRLLYLINNENDSKCMGIRAVESVKLYSKDIVMKRWIDLFNGL